MTAENIWRPEYALDIDEIDKQHKNFLSLISRLGGQIDSARSGNEVPIGLFFRTLFQMRKYAFQHFNAEEELLIKYAYPGLFDHLELHNKYIVNAIDIVTRVKPFVKRFNEPADEEFLATLDTVSDFFLDWWTTHIVEDVSKYARHIREESRLEKN